MDRRRVAFLFLNVGHAYDHLFMLLYPTVVLTLGNVFPGSYGDLLNYAFYGFLAFGGGSYVAGWLGDRWSRVGMMIVFFIGLGAASIFTGLATSPLGIALGLMGIGLFASIYHPVGIAMVSEYAQRTGRDLGINGVFGNMGIAAAAVTAAALTDWISWRAAFIIPGAISIATGVAYALFNRRPVEVVHAVGKAPPIVLSRSATVRIFCVIAVATAFGGIIFNSTTVSLPKVFDERLSGLVDSTTGVGGLVTLVFAVSAFSQIVVGHLIDRYSIKAIFALIAFCQVVALSLVAVAAQGAMLVAAMAMMILVFGQIPITDTLVARHSTAEWRARIYALKYLVSLTAAAAGVPLVAFLHDWRGGFDALFFTLSASAAIVCIAVLSLPALRQAPAAAAPAAE